MCVPSVFLSFFLFVWLLFGRISFSLSFTVYKCLNIVYKLSNVRFHGSVTVDILYDAIHEYAKEMDATEFSIETKPKMTKTNSNNNNNDDDYEDVSDAVYNLLGIHLSRRKNNR